MQIIIKNRLNNAEPLVLTNMNVQLSDLILSLAMAPEQKRSKVSVFFAQKVKHIPKKRPSLEDISKILCGAVQPTDWHISHLSGRRLSIVLKGCSAYWNTLEIDETSFFKHRVENPQLLEHIIQQHAKPMQTKIKPPLPEAPALGMRPPLETPTLKLESKVNITVPRYRTVLLSGLVGMMAGLALFLFNAPSIAIIGAIVASSLLSFAIMTQLQKNNSVLPGPITLDSANPLSPYPTRVLPPKKPLVNNRILTETTASLSPISVTLSEESTLLKKQRA